MQKRNGFENEKFFMVPYRFYHHSEQNPLISGCYLSYIGYFPLALYHYRERSEGTEDFIFLYCTGGNGTIQIEDKPPYILSKGQITVIPAHTAHKYYASAVNPWSIFWMHVNGSVLNHLWNNYALGVSKYLSPQNCILLESLFTEVFEIFKNSYSDLDYFYACQIASHIIGITVSETYETPVSQKSEKIIMSAIDFMKHNLHRSITLSELSDACHYSQTYINQLFKKYRQCTPLQFFNQMKIQAASKELYFSERPIKEIAYDYGFEDPLYFSRQFRRTFGISPKEYRAQQPG